MPDQCDKLDMLGCDVPLEDELIKGRRYMRELLRPEQIYNHAQYRFWLDYLQTLAISRFEWVGMPAGIDTRAVEYILMYFGLGAIFEDEGGMLFAQAAPSDLINMYYNPNEILLIAPNGAQWQRHCQAWVDNGAVMPRDAVVCFDNLMRRPLLPALKLYARKLATIDAIVETNMGAQRTPFIVYGSETSARTRQAIIQQLMQNRQYIELNNAIAANEQMVGVLQTEAPYVAEKLLADKQKILNEVVTVLGIDNTNTEKRERMIDAEATSNNEQIYTARRSALAARRQFAEQANVVFGLDISVKWAIPHPSTQEGGGDSEQPAEETGEDSGNADQR